ncbi:MAG: low molecular weight protein-tyrosine-phosphatase [Phycisphaerales bacterium JB050]
MSENQTPARSVLFVCMGNICRSPLAEGVFLHLLRERGLDSHFEVDSAGTGGWHVGNPPDPRSVAVASKHGIDLPSRARVIHRNDWEKFDLIIVMDNDNLSDCLDAGAPRHKIRHLRSFDPETNGSNLPVPDPYYGGEDGFETVFAMVHSACMGLIDELIRNDQAQETNST